MLPREIIRRVREIQIRTGRQVADVLAGQYVSVFKGSGIEFDEVRPYVPGDEIRSIDWNVTARFGQPFVKRYVEERQLTLMLMADISASMDFGSTHRSKREVAAELCALLAFSAASNDDKVGLTLFHGDIESYIPARKGQRHALRVVREVLAHGAEVTQADESTARSSLKPTFKPTLKPTGLRRWPFAARRRKKPWGQRRHGTHIGKAVEFLLSISKRRTVTFVVSDFFDEDYIRALQMAARRHDVIAVLITDPSELELQASGLVRMLDPETGRVVVRDTSSSAVHRVVREESTNRIEELQSQFRRAKIDFIHVDASQSVVDPIAKFFRMRERRR